MTKYLKNTINGFDFFLIKEGNEITYIDVVNKKNDEFDKNEVASEKEFTDVIKELKEYLEGKRKVFTFKVKMIGTDFQKRVWQELLNITYGKKVSYESIAIKVGGKNKVRAVANAVGRNPLLLFIPCHRIIYKNNELGGFSSGIENKKFFLNLEEENS